jgi:hypothetical protein
MSGGRINPVISMIAISLSEKGDVARAAESSDHAT